MKKRKRIRSKNKEIPKIKLPNVALETLHKRGGSHGHKKGKKLYSRKRSKQNLKKTGYNNSGLYFFNKKEHIHMFLEYAQYKSMY
ncbi:hypothetical protein C0583_05675 [Candidatus Parcubacteria bacterium]|nr:MAG: hypothetical protein C0583_05675 [Candidatus Parcubacteria bacterium]